MLTRNIIREDGFNRAVIESLYQNGDAVVTLQEVAIDDEGVEFIVREAGSIVFEAGSFDFTAEELAELNPQVINNLEI